VAGEVLQAAIDGLLVSGVISGGSGGGSSARSKDADITTTATSIPRVGVLRKHRRDGEWRPRREPEQGVLAGAAPSAWHRPGWDTDLTDHLAFPAGAPTRLLGQLGAEIEQPIPNEQRRPLHELPPRVLGEECLARGQVVVLRIKSQGFLDALPGLDLQLPDHRPITNLGRLAGDLPGFLAEYPR